MTIEDERRLILRMLQDGKITEDEAIALLESLKTSKKAGFGDEFSQFAEKIARSAQDLGRKSHDFLSGLDLESINVSPKKFTSSMDQSKSLDISDLNFPSLKLDLKSTDLSIKTWDKDAIQVDANLEYDKKDIKTKTDFFDIEIDNQIISIKAEDIMDDLDYHMDLSINLPQKSLNKIDLKTVNSKVTMTNILGESLNIESTNGQVLLDGLEAVSVDITSTNGKIQVDNIIADYTKISSTNGKITVDHISGKNVDLTSTQGHISISNIEEPMETVDIDSSMGNISIDLSFYPRPTKAILTNVLNEIDLKEGFNQSIFTNFIKSEDDIIAYSKDYNSDEDHLLVRARATRGKINI